LKVSLLLEGFKFAVFVSTPIITSYIFCNDAAVEKIVTRLRYITYPAEGERVPASDVEVKERMAAMYAAAKSGNSNTDGKQ